MRQDCIPMLTNLAALSKSVADPWCHRKSHEAAMLVGKVAWARLKEHVDVTWKRLPMEMAIDPGLLTRIITTRVRRSSHLDSTE